MKFGKPGSPTPSGPERKTRDTAKKIPDTVVAALRPAVKAAETANPETADPESLERSPVSEGSGTLRAMSDRTTG